MANIFRKLPSVNQLLESPQLKQMVQTVNHSVVADGVRSFLDELREQVSTESGEVTIPTPSEIADKIANWLKTEEKPYLRPVINGTGIILHTGLGRAPLANSAIESVQKISEGYASVEVDVRTGERGQRIKSVEKLLCELTGAEAAAVVNNNAAATMIALSAMAQGKEVIVSRGQLIEIGGSYRLPDVMECSGAKLREVGTTNKTHLFDYERAINEETGALLKVHPSNFEVVGFTKTVTTKEMVALASEHGLPVIDDVGSGALIDFAEFGLMDEPVVSQSIKDGADIVLFSGDKLIGGPQCGIIIGKKKYINTILSNPLMRAMRVDKMTLAALSATLLIYRDESRARTEIPILRMLSMPRENLKLRAEKVVTQLSHLTEFMTCEAVEA
ncbi:MAG: L-seryl-tRNA(Sec) selenium transferase, partial [Mariniblastus sp.]